ncbi:TPA: HD domain-containing phosphohydrolase [Pseudomonas aeruginosa]
MNDSAPPSNETEIRFSVLLVDDEPLILSSLRRLLRNQPYDLLLAESGEQALQLLESRPVDLVVSDARMPNMDGAALLAEIHRRSPETIRILLTGHADLPTIAKAINEGRIHHYLSKPWNDDELLLTLRQSLEYLHSERERRRLERLTQEQNDRLQQLNATLEKRVQARTAELQQTADMLDLAYEELKRSYVVGTEVFSLLVNQRLPKDKQTNQQIIELVRACCASGLVDESDGRDLAMAAALYNIGKLSWNDTLLSSPSDLLYHHDRDRFRGYPELSESLLMSLEPMQDAARLIRHHQEHWDGSGYPDHLKGEAIPLGSRLLKLAVDFVELQRGLILERRMNRDEALMYIRKYAGRLYDPELIEPFIQVCATPLADVTLADPQVRAHGTRDLVPGMVLARNLTANNGMLLLNAGKVLNLALIEKLIAFEAIEGARYTLFVRLPESTT